MQRHETILNILAKEKHIEVLDLCKKLNVSAVTIRKDLKLLEEKGLLFRTHGGASLETLISMKKRLLKKKKFQLRKKMVLLRQQQN